jgi:hypothetical protein
VSDIEARYANHFEIGENALEFIMAFGLVYEDQDSAVIHTKIITNPYSAKRFAEFLQESIRRHEQSSGPIPETLP